MKESLRTAVYRQLLGKIISGELPPDSFTNEDMLMEMTGSGRTPVREAVQKLEEGRFVKVFPKRGIYISELTARGLREVFEVRRMAEPFIVRNYGFRIPRDDIEQLRDELRDSMASGDLQACDRNDGRMHMQLLAANSNDHLADLLVRMYDHSSRFMNAAGVGEYEGHRETFESAAEVLDLMLEGRYDEAAEVLERHLVSTEQIISDSVTSGKGF